MTSDWQSGHGAHRFIAAFNDIEQHLRARLQARDGDSFRRLIDSARHEHLLNSQQAEALHDYTSLRNAISHGRYHGGAPIAEPNPRVIEQIERLRDLLMDPPGAVARLGDQKVETVTPEDSVLSALELIRTHGFSQLPVYDSGAFLQLLTTNTIAHWVAADLGDNQTIDARTVADVLERAENTDRAVFLPKTVGAQAAIDALTSPARDGSLPFALIITETGEKSQRPIRVITQSDVGVLLEAVEWE